jgi:PilZ domain
MIKLLRSWFPLEFGAMDHTKAFRYASQFPTEQRVDPRFSLEVPLRVHFKTGELILGRTVDISESGLSALVLLQMTMGQPIELDFKLSCLPVDVHAIVRNKNAFRYGLEFVLTDKERTIIKRGCRELAHG